MKLIIEDMQKDIKTMQDCVKAMQDNIKKYKNLNDKNDELLGEMKAILDELLGDN